jgi:uncharacterized tellurite resistance protein B-like protein
MFGLLDTLLGRAQPGQAPAPPNAAEHHVAAAALLVEAAHADGRFGEPERTRIGNLLADRLGLEHDAARQLVAEAEAEASADWHGFTRVLKDVFDHDGRIAVVEMLWEVVLADGDLHDYEASLMRRVPALLYVSDRENAEARGRALERLQSGGERHGGPQDR